MLDGYRSEPPCEHPHMMARCIRRVRGHPIVRQFRRHPPTMRAPRYPHRATPSDVRSRCLTHVVGPVGIGAAALGPPHSVDANTGHHSAPTPRVAREPTATLAGLAASPGPAHRQSLARTSHRGPSRRRRHHSRPVWPYCAFSSRFACVFLSHFCPRCRCSGQAQEQDHGGMAGWQRTAGGRVGRS